MKAIIKISQASFGKFKLHAITQAPNDYYNQPHARSCGYYRQKEARFSNREAEFIERVKKIQARQHPFNIYVKLHNFTWYGECTVSEHAKRDKYLSEIHVGDDWEIWSSWGYYINHQTQTYAYRTCGGNMWGVYKDLEKNAYFAFFEGARVYARTLAWYLSDNEIDSTPMLLETNAPKDMHWYERQVDYLIRKGEAHTAKYLAKTIGGIPQERLEDGENVCDAYGYFACKNPNFDKLIYDELFKNQNPEHYLLRRYPNKINPANLTGKDLTAWNLLDKTVQERILRWKGVKS